MKGRYDDLPQESWGRADSDMPQEYLEGILSQITPRKKNDLKKSVDQIYRRKSLKMEIAWNKAYYLAEVEYFNGGYTKTWRPRKQA